MARQVLENGVILPSEYSDDWYDDMTSNLTKLDDVIGSNSEKLSSADVGAAALSNNYNDLDNLPTIPTVNDATLTIQKNGVDVQTFTANASSNVTANITVPTKTSDLTNDSNFVDTSNSAVSSGITSAKVTDYDTHIADTDIHVTSSDKTSWNTVTSKANDSDVVHKSGDETADGLKTFLKYITSNGSSAGGEYSSNTRTNLWLMSNRDQEKVSGILFDTYRQNTSQGTGIHILGICIKENSVRYEGCRWGWYWDNNLNGYNFDFKPTTQGDNQAVKHNLGTSTDKWDTINGLNPSSLGMPDLSNGIDISSYLDTSQSSRNYYTPPVNGWISIKGSSSNTSGVVIMQDGMAQMGYSLIDFGSTNKITFCALPVKAGVQVEIWLKSVTSLDSAKFFPCLGNV